MLDGLALLEQFVGSGGYPLPLTLADGEPSHKAPFTVFYGDWEVVEEAIGDAIGVSSGPDAE